MRTHVQELTGMGEREAVRARLAARIQLSSFHRTHETALVAGKP
jgi:hypothetical protein